MKIKKGYLIGIVTFIIAVLSITVLKVYGNTFSTTKLNLSTGFCATEDRAAEVALYDGISLPVKSVKVINKNGEIKDITANLKTAKETNIYKSDTDLFKYKDLSKYKVITCTILADSYKTPFHKLEANTNTGMPNVSLNLTNNNYLGYYNVFDAALEVEFYDNEVKDIDTLQTKFKGHIKDQAFVTNVLDGKIHSYVIPPEVREKADTKEFYNYLTVTYYSARQELLEENVFKDSEFQNLASQIKFSENDSVYSKSKAIMDYLKANIKFDYGLIYSSTRNKEYQTIQSTISNKKTNCQGFAFTYYALAKYFGLESNYISGKAKLEGDIGHRWNVVHDDSDKYIFIDCTNGYIGYGDDNFYKEHLIYNANTDKFENVSPYSIPLYPGQALIK